MSLSSSKTADGTKTERIFVFIISFIYIYRVFVRGRGFLKGEQIWKEVCDFLYGLKCSVC